MTTPYRNTVSNRSYPKGNTMRRITTALAALALALGLLGLGPAPKAAATITWVSGGGTIQGYYQPSPYRQYGGYVYPVSGQCVKVQRQAGGGEWTTNYVPMGGQNCNPNAHVFWQITSDYAVPNTYGIRLLVSSGSNTGRTVRLCGGGRTSSPANDKLECLGMR